MYKARTYRNWVEDKGLVGFTVKLDESDLFIRADKTPPYKGIGGSIPVDKLLNSQAQTCLGLHRRFIQGYIQKNPEFAAALEPYSVKEDAPDIVKEMALAASKAGVGPMAAVAGAIAEYVGKDLLKYSSQVIVENGGDIFMKTDKIRKVGIFAGQSAYSGKLALEIASKEECLGICTSSGNVGPSLSFGRADACVVICNSAILADAWATRLGNEVKSASDVDRTLNLVKEKSEIKGVIIIVGDKIGVQGEIKLIKSQMF